MKTIKQMIELFNRKLEQGLIVGEERMDVIIESDNDISNLELPHLEALAKTFPQEKPGPAADVIIMIANKKGFTELYGELVRQKVVALEAKIMEHVMATGGAAPPELREQMIAAKQQLEEFQQAGAAAPAAAEEGVPPV